MNHITGLLADKYSDRHLHGQMDRRKTDIMNHKETKNQTDRWTDRTKHKLTEPIHSSSY